MGIPPGIGGCTRTHTQDLPTPGPWVRVSAVGREQQTRTHTRDLPTPGPRVQVSAVGREQRTHTHTQDLPAPGAWVWVSATCQEKCTQGMTHHGSYPQVLLYLLLRKQNMSTK